MLILFFIKGFCSVDFIFYKRVLLTVFSMSKSSNEKLLQVRVEERDEYVPLREGARAHQSPKTLCVFIRYRIVCSIQLVIVY